MEAYDDIITPVSCANLKFRIDMVPATKQVVTVFPVLMLYPEFKERLAAKLEIDLILRYIMILYQERSPLFTVEDYTRRKIYAALFAGFPKKDGKFVDAYKDIIFGKNKTVNRMAIRFCRMQRNTDFSRLAIYESALYADSEAMADPDTDPDTRKKLMANIEALTKTVNDLIGNFLAGDQSQFVIEDLMDEIELGTLDIKPEDVAKKFRDIKGAEEWGQYYGKNYRFQLFAKVKVE